MGFLRAFGGLLVDLGGLLLGFWWDFGEPLMNFCWAFDGFGWLLLCISLAFGRLFVDFWWAFWLAFDMLFVGFWLALVNFC